MLQSSPGISLDASWVTIILALIAAGAGVLNNIIARKNRDDLVDVKHQTNQTNSDLRAEIKAGNDRFESLQQLFREQAIAAATLAGVTSGDQKAAADKAAGVSREAILRAGSGGERRGGLPAAVGGAPTPVEVVTVPGKPLDVKPIGPAPVVVTNQEPVAVVVKPEGEKAKP